MKARVVLKGLALILSLALLGYLFETSDLGSSVNEAWIDARVRGHGVNGALLFLLMGGLFTAIGLPRQIIAFLGGYAFSVGLGTLFGALAALLGCMLSFGYARLFGKGLLRARLGERAGRFDRFIHDHPFSMTVLVRWLPAFPASAQSTSSPARCSATCRRRWYLHWSAAASISRRP